MAMLVAEPPVNITSHDEMDATEIMESMYLADEERRQEEAPTYYPAHKSTDPN